MSLYDYAKSQNQNEILIFLENVESYQVILYFSAVKIAFLFRDRQRSFKRRDPCILSAL
jgi:hypothetical protein